MDDAKQQPPTGQHQEPPRDDIRVAAQEQATIGAEEAKPPAAQAATAEQLEKAETKIEERMSAFESSMIRLTRYGLAVTCLTGFIFLGQLYEMYEGGTATDKLVGYANTQAQAASDISDAANDFTDSAHWMEEHMDDAATAMQDSVDTASQDTQTIIQNARDSFRTDQRAWVGMAHMGLDGTRIINLGKTPAFNIVFRGAGHFDEHEVEVTDKWIAETEKQFPPLKTLRMGVMFPGQPLAEPAPNFTADPTWEKVKNHQMFLYVFAKVTYFDTFRKKHTTRMCGLWVPEINSFDPGAGCTKYNTAD